MIRNFNHPAEDVNDKQSLLDERYLQAKLRMLNR